MYLMHLKICQLVLLYFQELLIQSQFLKTKIYYLIDQQKPLKLLRMADKEQTLDAACPCPRPGSQIIISQDAKPVSSTNSNLVTGALMFMCERLLHPWGSAQGGITPPLCPLSGVLSVWGRGILAPSTEFLVPNQSRLLDRSFHFLGQRCVDSQPLLPQPIKPEY